MHTQADVERDADTDAYIDADAYTHAPMTAPALRRRISLVQDELYAIGFQERLSNSI